MAATEGGKRLADRVTIYDTTLRDGSQGEGISFSIEDKLRIAHKLDEFGVDYVEAGWPGSNPKDDELFQRLAGAPLTRARLAAFGSTRRPRTPANEDPTLLSLVRASAPVCTIFGKSWDMHVTHALKVSLAENLEMIADSVAYLRGHVDEVVYDAEHFFDGYKRNPDYAMRTLAAAHKAGASALVLCDTNGGCLPHEVAEITEAVVARFGGIVGIHTHDDSGCGVANALAAVRSGARHVQGTINGYGERCGNANLCVVAPNLRLKLGMECLEPDALQHLTGLSQYIDEVANLSPTGRQPYVGKSAFAHKAGVHVDAVLKHRATYEHIDPEQVGNSRRMLVSELSGGSMVVNKAAERHIDLQKKSPETRHLLRRVADMEKDGYSFEGAEASFELLLMNAIGTYRSLVEISGFRVIVEKRKGEEPTTEATIKLSVDGLQRLTVAEGDGPVHALDTALRKALLEFYPQLEGIWLTDFKVRVVNVRAGTAARVRAIVDSSNGDTTWSTVGVSHNMVEAGWHALLDGIIYGLLRAGVQPYSAAGEGA